MGCIMGKISRFLVILLAVCSLNFVLPKPAHAEDCAWYDLVCLGKKAYDATIGETVEAVQNTCWDDCDKNDWSKDLDKLYQGGSEGQAVFAQIFENSQYSKCAICTENNCNIAGHFNQANCLTTCQNAGNVQNCESHCNNVKQTTRRECDEAQAGYGCAAAQVSSYLGNLTGGLMVIGGAALAIFGGPVGIAAGIALAAAGGVVIAQSNVKGPNFNLILANFVDFGDKGCWFCPVFTTVFHTINTLATTMYTNLRDVFFSILIIITMAWLLWEVLKFMTTIHGPNIGEFVTKLFKGLGTVMLLAIILKAPPSFITGYVIDIPVGIATGLAGDIMQMTGVTEKVQEPYSYTLSNGCVVNTTREKDLCVNSDPNSAEFKDKMMSSFIHDSMLCLLKKISLNLITGMAIGSTVLQYGFFAGTIFPELDIVFAGLIVLAGYFVLYIMVPFKLIDILLRMGFAIILLPVFVTCMATEKTRDYSKKGWQMFLGCWITLICLCVFLVLALQIVAMALTQ